LKADLGSAADAGGRLLEAETQDGGSFNNLRL
jgi:hypothetical protein